MRIPTAMTVIIDGKECERAVSHYDKENKRYVPKLLPAEDVDWEDGMFYPTIIKTQIVHRDDNYEVCAMCESPFFIKRCNRCGYEPA